MYENQKKLFIERDQELKEKQRLKEMEIHRIKEEILHNRKQEENRKKIEEEIIERLEFTNIQPLWANNNNLINYNKMEMNEKKYMELSGSIHIGNQNTNILLCYDIDLL
jgi:hypothetical protein